MADWGGREERHWGKEIVKQEGNIYSYGFKEIRKSPYVIFGQKGLNHQGTGQVAGTNLELALIWGQAI